MHFVNEFLELVDLKGSSSYDAMQELNEITP